MILDLERDGETITVQTDNSQSNKIPSLKRPTKTSADKDSSQVSFSFQSASQKLSNIDSEISPKFEGK